MKVTLYYRNKAESDNEYGKSHFDDKQEVEDIIIRYEPSVGLNNFVKVSLRELLTRMENSAELDFDKLLYSGHDSARRNRFTYHINNQFHDTIDAEFGTEYGLELKLFENGRHLFTIRSDDSDIANVEMIPKDKALIVYGEPIK